MRSSPRLARRSRSTVAYASGNVVLVIRLDTSPEAHEAQMQAYRRMGPEGRVRVGFSMSEDVRVIAAEGIRSRHPGYAGAQVRGALFRLLYGDELTRAVWPDEALVAP